MAHELIDKIVVKMGDGADPEVFTLICGIQDVSVNENAETQDKSIPDCTKPFAVPTRGFRTTSKSLTVTGTGVPFADEIAKFEAALGVKKSYKLEALSDNGTDAGLLLGTFDGTFGLTQNNLSTGGNGSREITLINDGPWTYTPAP